MPEQREYAKIYQLNVELAEIEPPIWRRFVVPSTVTLHRFHLILQEIMGWSIYHLYRFKMGNKQYGEPNPDNEFYELHFVNSKRAILGKTLAEKGETLVYEYDFGDGWIHQILLEDSLKSEPGTQSALRASGNARRRTLAAHMVI